MAFEIKNKLTGNLILSGKGDLREVDLRCADLSGADLREADLHKADLREAKLVCGETWEQYLDEVVPTLLTAGGKTLKDIVIADAWECHHWGNCPMAIAFSVVCIEDAPKLYWPRIKEFIQYFDALLIPCPIIKEKTV